MPIIRSLANEDEIAEFSEGSCHVFALAVHRMTGWPMHVVLDHGEPYWVDPEDCDNWIPSVIHVFCVDESDRFWDIQGCRPRDEVYREMTDWMNIIEYDSDLIHDEAALSIYVGCWGEDELIDRPLMDYTEAEVTEAASAARRVLGGLPDNPASRAVGQPSMA